MQFAAGNLQLATCNMQLATLIAQFVCSLIFHAIILLVYHLYSIYLMMLFLLLLLCIIAVWWKPQRGFARFYWLCSAPRGSFVRHSGAWQWEQLEPEQAWEWEELPTDILWTTSMHRSCRCVFYTLYTLCTLSVTSSLAYHTIATFSSLLTLRFGHRCRIFFWQFFMLEFSLAISVFYSQLCMRLALMLHS